MKEFWEKRRRKGKGREFVEYNPNLFKTRKKKKGREQNKEEVLIFRFFLTRENGNCGDKRLQDLNFGVGCKWKDNPLVSFGFVIFSFFFLVFFVDCCVDRN